MSRVVVEFECFYDKRGGQIIKELCVMDMDYNVLMHEVYKMPPTHSYPKKYSQANSYVTQRLHKLQWTEGDKYWRIADIRRKLSGLLCQIKGIQKYVYFTRLLPMLNVMLLQTPPYHQLLFTRTMNCKYVHGNNCALKNVVLY